MNGIDLMDQTTLTQETISELRLFVRWAISSLIDSMFLGLWVVIQWGVSKLIDSFPLFNVDLWVLWCFRIIFACTTLIPIIIYIYEDTMVMIYRAAKRIKEEKKFIRK
jgi:hypothetical protein